jgi:hypothetical protein
MIVVVATIKILTILSEKLIIIFQKLHITVFESYPKYWNKFSLIKSISINFDIVISY